MQISLDYFALKFSYSVSIEGQPPYL